MIIVIFPTDLNIDNAKKLSRSNFFPKEDEDDKLEIQFFPRVHARQDATDIIIFNVNADGDFQKGSVGWLVDKLNANGILEHVKNIYLIMPNLSQENPLHLYAQNMADYIDEKYKKIVYVHVPNKVGEQFTIIIPPTKTDGKTWKIRVLDHIPENVKLDLDTLMELKTKVSEKTMTAAQLKAHMDDPQFTNKPSSIDPFTDLPRETRIVKRW
jgi:hypothetical protein